MDLKVNLKSFFFTGLLLVLALSFINVQAQPDIVKAEYFINEDPGFGLGIPITITNGQTIDVNFNATTDTLSSGYHSIYIRTQDALGVWSYHEGRQFYVIDTVSATPIVTPDLVALEYFINDDPGQGLATPLAVTNGLTIEINDLAITDTLSAGYHIVGTRAKTANGTWGWYERRSFYVTTTGSVVVPPKQNIVAVEYYFDVDPGLGMATSLGSFGPTLSIDLNELVPSSLTPGYHTFNVRSQYENGYWGFLEQRPIYVITAGTTTSITDINKIEYFIDGVDPGVGKATNLPITPGQVIELNTVDIPTSPSLIDGEHYITFRARNDNGWGMAEIDTFDILDDCTQPIAAFTPQIACAGQPVTFVDNSDSVQVDATYRWYLDGDTIVDDTTVGNATFTYPFPGTYVVALAIRQGTICLDSITTTIDIQSLPVAVFSTSGTEVNQTIFFTASASNLPPNVTWEWDFDDDLVVDDTTSGNTSFIYTAEGTYNPTLTISDGLGCGVSVSNTITISGTSTSPPFVDFLADNSCVGSTINFIDLSQNLPDGSTYSWDFDGDGIEDDTTSSSVSFAYPAAGSFDAKLIIDIGVGTLEAVHTIEIVEFPIADFSATDVCEGAPMDFTDLSTNTETTAVYMWDFDNDGVIDSNAKTGVAFTFTGVGSQIVSLTISNGFGCTNTVVKQVSVVALPAPDFEWDIVCTGEVVSFNNLSAGVDNGAIYSWDLDGDGNEDSSLAGDVDFTFTTNGIYNASLTIDNFSGCAVTTTRVIEIFDRPAVAIDVIAQCYGQESQMLDLSQNVSSTAIYSWDFDNDGIEDDATVGSTTFTYPVYNSYVVKLNIDNGGGCTAAAEDLVVFSDAASPDFSFGTTCEDVEVIFTDLSTALATGATYSWDFDGNGLADSEFPGSTAFTFSEAGIYNATLTIDNGGQCLAYKTIPVQVTAPPAVTLGADVFLCNDSTVVLDAGTGYSWYFWPDGSANQTYTIDQVGEYWVTVADAKSCQNSDTIRVAFLGDPVPSFEYSYRLSLDGVYVNFTNTTDNGTGYMWDFGDGSPPVFEANPIHLYEEYFFYKNTFYEVTMTATNDCGRPITTAQMISLSPTALTEDIAGMAVYPNPVTDILVVQLDDALARPIQLQLFDPQGKSVWRLDKPALYNEVDVSAMRAGLYILAMVREEGLFYRSVAIK
jgi:PKD repeat protein